MTDQEETTCLLGVRILLVDDDPYSSLVAQHMLEFWSASIDTADNGQDAVDKVKAQLYDLILMDIQMPVMDGISATRAVREINPTIPVIALTASEDQEEDMVELSGFNNSLTKPYTPEELLDRINAVLKK